MRIWQALCACESGVAATLSPRTPKRCAVSSPLRQLVPRRGLWNTRLIPPKDNAHEEEPGEEQVAEHRVAEENEHARIARQAARVRLHPSGGVVSVGRLGEPRAGV